MTVIIYGLLSLVLFIFLIYSLMGFLKENAGLAKLMESVNHPFDKLKSMKLSPDITADTFELRGQVKCRHPLTTPMTKSESVYYNFTISEFYADNQEYRGVKQFQTRNIDVFKQQKKVVFELLNREDSIPVVIEKGVKITHNAEHEFEYKHPIELEGLDIDYRAIPTDVMEYGYVYTEKSILVDDTIHFLGHITFHDEAYHLDEGSLELLEDIEASRQVNEKKALMQSYFGRMVVIFLLFMASFFGFIGHPKALAGPIRELLKPVEELTAGVKNEFFTDESEKEKVPAGMDPPPTRRPGSPGGDFRDGRKPGSDRPGGRRRPGGRGGPGGRSRPGGRGPGF
ncbi:MAG: hypothetical protein ACLFQV_08260 [Vulcanimicrobiota bacterium]